MKSEREKLYEKIEAIGGMEELDRLVGRKQSYGGYEAYEEQWECASREEVMQKAKMESNAEYFERVRVEEAQHLASISQCEKLIAEAETRKLWENAHEQDYKADAGKLRLSLVPVSGIEAVARVREYGVSKYHTEQGWDKVEIRRYVDALGRHFMEFLKDNNGVDSESGLPHMEHICCNAFFIIELMQRGENAKM